MDDLIELNTRVEKQMNHILSNDLVFVLYFIPGFSGALFSVLAI